MKKKNVPVKYTSRDFQSYREDLVEYAKRYYPDTFKDWSQASFGSLIVDQISYLGDNLSFYLDYQTNEAFLTTANEYNNILKLARAHGYKFDYNNSSYGTITLYIMVPANTNNLGPNTAYLPILRKGSTFTAKNGNLFMLLEDIDFAYPGNQVVAGAVNQTTGIPTYYAVRASGKIISGELALYSVAVGAFERFRKIRIPESYVAEIVSVFDSEGHEYYEVQNLAHDIVYREVSNSDCNRDTVHALMMPFVATRRFVVERDLNSLYLQFGAGSDTELQLNIIPDPANVVLDRYGQDYVSSTRLDPSNIIKSDRFGIAPANTTLRIVYRLNRAKNVNAASNTITEVARPTFKFQNVSALASSEVSAVINSLECSNEEPIVGDISLPTVEELKQRVYGVYSAQERAVTAEDYKSMIYSMPRQFGAIKRCGVYRDGRSNKLRLFVISEDENGHLVTTNSTLKSNLKIWLNKNKMVHDYIEIEDAKVVNIGVKYTIVSNSSFDQYDVLNACSRTLSDAFANKPDVGEDVSITDIYKILNRTRGVDDTISVKVVNKSGGGYSSRRFSLEANTSADGRTIYIPQNCIYEVKYVNDDIVGTIR